MATSPSSTYTGNGKWCTETYFPFGVDWYSIRSLAALRRQCMDILHGQSVYLMGGAVRLKSHKFSTDDFEGICEDRDHTSIRYVNNERDRVFKMRAGKFLRSIVEEWGLDEVIPYNVKIWLCEDFAEQWKAYALSKMNDTEYTLHVNDNFEDIYDSCCCEGDFGSCMVNDGYWTFYRDSVDAKAAYLTRDTDDGELIVARCIIYTNVHVYGTDRTLRLAERQYSTDGDESLKRVLVMRLIAGGYIDGYKKVGADCHSPKAFVGNDGNPLESLDLWIDCRLEQEDTCSYQDSLVLLLRQRQGVQQQQPRLHRHAGDDRRRVPQGLRLLRGFRRQHPA